MTTSTSSENSNVVTNGHIATRRRSNSQVRLTCIRGWDITYSELNQFCQSKQNGYTPVVATARGSYPHVDKIPDHVDRLQN